MPSATDVIPRSSAIPTLRMLYRRSRVPEMDVLSQISAKRGGRFRLSWSTGPSHGSARSQSQLDPGVEEVGVRLDTLGLGGEGVPVGLDHVQLGGDAGAVAGAGDLGSPRAHRGAGSR